LIEKLESGNHHYDPDRLERGQLRAQLAMFADRARDFRKKHGLMLGRARTHDTVTGTSISFRMNAGIPGSVNRSHPASIEPVLIDSSAPPTLYGQGVVIDATTEGVRPIAASGDTALTDVYGITVRPFPLQQATTTGALYTAVPPIAGLMDVLKFGYVMVGFNKSGSAPVKGGQAYIWAAATSTVHIVGGWETATSGSVIDIGTPPRTNYQGGWDANDVGELIFHD